MITPLVRLAKERAETEPVRLVSDDDLVRALVGTNITTPTTLSNLAWASPKEIAEQLGVSPARAARLAAAFELGRRGAWAPPRRGERCLDPRRVYELMRHAAHAEREGFHVILLDVRGALIKTAKIAEGSLTQCPVAPREVFREALLAAAHGLVFVHNHPSSADPSPSSDDFSLTERLRAAADLVGVVARDHVIVSANGYYSFVEAGRWSR